MANDLDWNEAVKLIRKAGGIAIAPDPPIWADAAVISRGTLAAMVGQWLAMPVSHQAYHAIVRDSGEPVAVANEVRTLAARSDFPG